MFDSLSELTSTITWHKVLIGALIFAGTFVINLAIVSFILVKLPANHFSKSRKTKFWSGPHPLLHATGVVGKNIGGVFLGGLGVGVALTRGPGQGVLDVVFGGISVAFSGHH